jgi:asparagine synthase (glutamine-hydrolysing)
MTARPASLETGSGPFRFRGVVEFDAISPEIAVSPTARGGVSSWQSAGVDVAWREDRADVAASERAIVIALGRMDNGSKTDARDWLQRYDDRGEDAAHDAAGAFAVVVVDLRARRVLLFVDRFAIETLCYRTEPGRIAFSDRACDVPGRSDVLDSQAIYDYLYFHAIPAPHTIFAGVLRVDRAQFVVAASDGVRAATYWHPAFVEDDRRDREGRLHEFVDIVKTSVARASDDATACFLSGGTDSSTVAGMLTRVRGKPAAAYSIGFDAAGYDEMAYARIAARHFGLAHHEYYVTPDDVVDAVPKLARSFDQPFGNSSVVPAYYCALRAREDGFTHMLAGDGGDELFAGNARYALQSVFELYHALPKPLRQNVFDPAALDWPLFRRVPGFRHIGGYIRHSRHPMPDRLETFQLLDRLAHEDMFEPDYLARIDETQPLAEQRREWQASSATTLINRMLAYDWKYTLADNDLPKVRQATQAASVTVAFPLLTAALTDFSLSVPPEWKLKRWKLRWFYKEALRGFLPPEILRKKKHGFGLPFGNWMLAHAGLHALAEDSLSAFARRGIMRQPFLERLLRVHLRDVPAYYGEMVWIVMMLEQWLRVQDEVTTMTSIRASSA